MTACLSSWEHCLSGNWRLCHSRHSSPAVTSLCVRLSVCLCTVELLEWRLREERALVDSLQGWSRLSVCLCTVELLEWRLREERALVDSLQGWSRLSVCLCTVELLEWRLREERALVDSLQGWLQAEHQAKLRLISGRLEAEPWPSAAALSQQQQQQPAAWDPPTPRQQQRQVSRRLYIGRICRRWSQRGSCGGGM